MQDILTRAICIVILLGIRYVVGQFPAACVDNATLPDAVCCPTPPGFSEPCGGPSRGHCVKLPNSDDLRNIPPVNQVDDRLNWPTRFFQFACQCVGNFSGYMCHECWYGITGPECNQRIKTVRKEVNSLTAVEKKKFVSALEQSMKVQSDYMVMNTSHSTDPAINPQFLSVSVYQYLSYLHYYVSRKTKYANESLCQDLNQLWLDGGHSGPSFTTWHRLYILKVERALRNISGDESFAMPYWDWIDDGNSCEVCTNDLVGETDWNDTSGRLSPDSVFSTWRIMCAKPESGCHVCDPYIDDGPIIRRPGGATEIPDLPTREDLEYALSLPVYDLDPYDIFTNNKSFRSVLEGFAGRNGPTVFGNYSMHNRVHDFLNGSMTKLQTAAMDPIFFLHHTFVDKIFEIWLRKVNASPRQLPIVGPHPGHTRHAFLIGFFPLESNFHFFQTSDKFGYDYSDMDNPKTDDEDKHIKPGPTSLTGDQVAAIVVGVILILVLIINIVAIVWLCKRRRWNPKG